MLLSIVISAVFSIGILLTDVIEGRSIFESHVKPSDVKYFESKLDRNVGYWSPSTSSIDWCERNYVRTEYVAEFWNSISSLFMCLLAGILFYRGLHNRIENRFLLLSLSFQIVGFGSTYFHSTLTLFGQMFDELPMVYSMIISWFISFRMNQVKLKSKRSLFDTSIIFGIFYGILWTYLHTLQTFVLIFQIHFTLMVLGVFIKLIYLYREPQYHTNNIMYLIIAYIALTVVATICWIIDQKLCERMNSIDGFNPQFHAWWHLFCAVGCHVGIVSGEAMRFLSIKYREHQMKCNQSSEESFKPEDHLCIVFCFGLPFVDYSNDKQINQTKNQ